MLWIYDVLIPALNRGRAWLDRHLRTVSWVLAAVVLLVSRGHVVLRAVCLSLCLVFHGLLVKRCRNADGSHPWPVYLSAFFPLLMVSPSFLGAPLAWQICMLAWAKQRR